MITDRLLARRFSEGMDVSAIAHRYGLPVARVEAAIRREFHRKGDTRRYLSPITSHGRQP